MAASAGQLEIAAGGLAEAGAIALHVVEALRMRNGFCLRVDQPFCVFHPTIWSLLWTIMLKERDE